MPEYELIKSLEREGFKLNFPSSMSNDEKIIAILKENDDRLNLAIPFLLEKEFDYTLIRDSLLKIKNGKEILIAFNKNILISKEIFRKLKKDTAKLDEIIQKNKISGKLNEKEVSYYFDEYKESKLELERSKFENNNLEDRKKIESFDALKNIFSPAKLKIMRKIYEFKDLTPTEKMYYYRDIKPLIDSVLNKSLQEYVEIVRDNRKRK
jgi:hypothetical protein